MLLCITFGTIPDDDEHFPECLFNIDMEKLKTVNSDLHDWILDDLSCSPVSDKSVMDKHNSMYEAIVEEACKGTIVMLVCKETRAKRLHVKLDERKIEGDIYKMRSSVFAEANDNAK
jgi:hypothetical protein